MNVQLKDITVTARDGRVSHLDQVYIRGSHVRFFIVPDMLRFASPPPAARDRGKLTAAETHPCSARAPSGDEASGWREEGLRSIAPGASRGVVVSWLASYLHTRGGGGEGGKGTEKRKTKNEGKNEYIYMKKEYGSNRKLVLEERCRRFVNAFFCFPFPSHTHTLAGQTIYTAPTERGNQCAICE